MCGHCSYGPMIHRACDDLISHHGETSHDNAKAAINNSCPIIIMFTIHILIN